MGMGVKQTNSLHRKHCGFASKGRCEQMVYNLLLGQILLQLFFSSYTPCEPHSVSCITEMT